VKSIKPFHDNSQSHRMICNRASLAMPAAFALQYRAKKSGLKQPDLSQQS